VRASEATSAIALCLTLRYLNRTGIGGLPGSEGAFLPCTLWLADCLALMGRADEARDTFARVVALVNDVGLISEEYDTRGGRLVGKFPQAFTHVAIINTAQVLAARSQRDRPAGSRPGGGVMRSRVRVGPTS
jgi:GH15 family glucan-1,4-alpha-glucosidase